MRLLDRQRLAGLLLPVFDEFDVVGAIKLTGRIVGYVEQIAALGVSTRGERDGKNQARNQFAHQPLHCLVSACEAACILAPGMRKMRMQSPLPRYRRGSKLFRRTASSFDENLAAVARQKTCEVSADVPSRPEIEIDG